jgi:hypothetical protein
MTTEKKSNVISIGDQFIKAPVIFLFIENLMFDL